MEIPTIKQIKTRLNFIPESQWQQDLYTDGLKRCCGLGHINRILSSNPNDFSVRNCDLSYKDVNFFGRTVLLKTREFCTKLFGQTASIVEVNDSYNFTRKFYPQSTPKARVMALLKDMIAAGY